MSSNLAINLVLTRSIVAELFGEQSVESRSPLYLVFVDFEGRGF